METLYLEKRGCDFFKGDAISNNSDLGNYRITTINYIPFKDGKDYFLEFSSYTKNVWRFTHKRNPSKKLAHPIIDKAIPYLMAASNEFRTSDGTFTNLDLYADMRKKGYRFNKHDLLALVNEYSVKHYTDIEFVGDKK